MTTKKSFLSLVLCLIATTSWAEDSKINLRTLQLAGGEMPELYIRMADAKELVKLTWLSTQPTESIEVIQDGSLKLYRQITNSEGKPAFEIASSIKLPSAANEVLLLVWESDANVKYVAIKDQFLNAKFDDWMAINTSRNPVAVLAGDSGKPVRVDAGASLIFQPEIEVGKGVKIIAQASRKGEVKTFASSYWPAFEGQRTMIIFLKTEKKCAPNALATTFPKRNKNLKKGE